MNNSSFSILVSIFAQALFYALANSDIRNPRLLPHMIDGSQFPGDAGELQEDGNLKLAPMLAPVQEFRRPPTPPSDPSYAPEDPAVRPRPRAISPRWVTRVFSPRIELVIAH